MSHKFKGSLDFDGDECNIHTESLQAVKNTDTGSFERMYNEIKRNGTANPSMDSLYDFISKHKSKGSLDPDSQVNLKAEGNLFSDDSKIPYSERVQIALQISKILDSFYVK